MFLELIRTTRAQVDIVDREAGLFSDRKAVAVRGLARNVPTHQARAGASSRPMHRAGFPGMPTLRIAQDAAADELLGRDSLVLLIGMLLDQHKRQRSSGACGEGDS